MINHLLDIIYPPACLICNNRTKDVLCKDCLRGIKKLNSAVNEIRYRKKGIYYERLYSFGLYDGALTEAIHLFKYKTKLALAGVFSKLLLEFIEKNIDITQFDVIVPIPLHNAKLREREFNQAQLLAGPIAKKFGIQLSTNEVRRIKDTLSQSNLTRSERLENLKGAFQVTDPKFFYKKKVLIVDDVFTTGSTVNECAKALKSCGAKTVEVLTLARGQ